jgi:hypothetical protein
MSKQTAVIWLEEQLNNKWLNEYLNPISIKSLIDQALQMEREQIEDAWNGGDYAYFYSKETGRDFVDGKEYYNETFGGQDE